MGRAGSGPLLRCAPVFSLADYAGCLAALIEALGLASLSWGSTVVQELYRHHPGLVATLILIGAYAGWKGSLPADEVAARVEGVGRLLAASAEAFDPILGLADDLVSEEGEAVTNGPRVEEAHALLVAGLVEEALAGPERDRVDHQP